MVMEMKLSKEGAGDRNAIYANAEKMNKAPNSFGTLDWTAVRHAVTC
jgi:hypothetical protein